MKIKIYFKKNIFKKLEERIKVYNNTLILIYWIKVSITERL
jgi:hypothetical protein